RLSAAALRARGPALLPGNGGADCAADDERHRGQYPGAATANAGDAAGAGGARAEGRISGRGGTAGARGVCAGASRWGIGGAGGRSPGQTGPEAETYYRGGGG